MSRYARMRQAPMAQNNAAAPPPSGMAQTTIITSPIIDAATQMDAFRTETMNAAAPPPLIVETGAARSTITYGPEKRFAFAIMAALFVAAMMYALNPSLTACQPKDRRHVPGRKPEYQIQNPLYVLLAALVVGLLVYFATSRM